MKHYTINVSQETIEKFCLTKIGLQSFLKKELTNDETVNLLLIFTAKFMATLKNKDDKKCLK